MVFPEFFYTFVMLCQYDLAMETRTKIPDTTLYNYSIFQEYLESINQPRRRRYMIFCCLNVKFKYRRPWMIHKVCVKCRKRKIKKNTNLLIYVGIM